MALTLGDPAGIGPEIAASLLARSVLPPADIYLVGSAGALMDALPPSFDKNMFQIVSHEGLKREEPIRAFPVVIDTGVGEVVPVGRPSAEGGLVAGRAIEAAVYLSRTGKIDGIVTGPISKEALNMAGYRYTGHTDMLADLFESPDCQMMMVAGDLRIVILTRDMPLRDVPGAVTASMIKKGVRATAGALRELWGIGKPRIAVAALNPHAGDGGVLGREEKDVIIPALEELLGDWFDVEGPFPADTLFCNWRKKGYDAFVALYHDQGMIPFKVNGFGQGVNMTIGLPVVRTSVCHGTAYDIAGRGVGEMGSLEAALSLAVRCCLAKREKQGV